MVLGGNAELLDELYSHCSTLGHFDIRTDSYHVSEALKSFSDIPYGLVLARFVQVIRRLRRTYGAVYRDIVKRLEHQRGLNRAEASRLFAEWDLMCGLQGRPKSDVVMRELGAVFRWSLPDGQVDWNGLPIES